MRRVVLPLFALMVLLPSLAQARARWMSDVDLYVREACCCPPKKLQPPSPQPTIQKVCCSLEKRSTTALPLASESPSPITVPALGTSASVAPVMPPLRTTVVAILPRAQAPPRSTLLAQSRGLLL